MNNMMLFLTTQLQIKEILLLLGPKSSVNLLRDIYTYLNLNRIVVCTSFQDHINDIDSFIIEIPFNKALCKTTKMEVIPYEKLSSYEKNNEEMAYVFDAIYDTNIILNSYFIKPKYLIGTCESGEIDVFGIWEQYRQTCEKIYMFQWGKNGDEVFEWERRESNTELSVILPMYNVAKYLPECIETVTAWNAPYIEFLFVDDGSPDNCSDIVSSYAKKDSRVKLLRKENGGCASARQYGLERATGRYIGFIDPDDYIDTSMYRKLLSRAFDGTYEIAYCGYNEYYENSKTSKNVPDTLGEPYIQGCSDQNKIIELISYLRVAIWRGIYKSDLIKRSKIHFHTDLKRFDDLPFKVEILSKANSIVSVPEYLYFYRMSRPGQDVSADDERLYVHFDIFKHIDKFMEKNGLTIHKEYLHLARVHTHMYAISKIKRRYLRTYMTKAKKDIRSNFGPIEGAYIINKLGSKTDVYNYLCLYTGSIVLLEIGNIITGIRTKKNNDAVIKKLRGMDSIK